ncbi:FG-GAP repeat domain-containing protein [Streptomyces sp. NPDC012825]|uniref:FG-GAP repeat domain-containing protein n=1 Tax=Streptomyces sp. NPDC012825 TaxID=3364851 RepID=UPI0036A6A189
MKINRGRRALKGAFVATAVAVAAATAAGTAFATGAPVGPGRAVAEAKNEFQPESTARVGAFDAQDEILDAPIFVMNGIHKRTGEYHFFGPNGTGGFDASLNFGPAEPGTVDMIDFDLDQDNLADGSWTLFKNGTLRFDGIIGEEFVQKQVGKGWNIYPTVFSPGSIGGAAQYDLLAIDTAGTLWSYLSYPDGRLTARTKVGGGWTIYNQVAGLGDLTGDGKADVVARDKAGVLWLYKGTGNYKAPFTARTQIGGGWNTFDRILSTGDLDLDGKVDLIARKSNGELYRYSGTGSAAAPFAKAVKIGTGFQNFNLL